MAAHRPSARPCRGAVVAAAVCVLVAVTGGCGGHGRVGLPVDPTVPPPTVGPPQTVRLGFLGVGPGPGRGLSRAVQDGERLAVSQFAGAGEDVDVTIVSASTGGTRTGAAAAAGQLVSDDVAAVIGPQSSVEVRGSAPVLDAAGIPLVTATATATDLAAAGWASFFRVVADDRQQGVATARELVGGLHVSDLALVAGGRSCDQTFVTSIDNETTTLGATVESRRTVTTPAARRVAAAGVVGSGVGGVYFCGTQAATRQFVEALVGYGYQGIVMVSSSSPSTVLAPLGTTADGVYVTSPADDPAAAAAGGGRALVFDDAYRAAFGSQPPTWAAEGYDATEAVLGAVAAGSATATGIGDYLPDHPTPGVTSTVSFGADGNQVDPPVFVSRVTGGKPVQIAVATQTTP